MEEKRLPLNALPKRIYLNPFEGFTPSNVGAPLATTAEALALKLPYLYSV